MTSAARSVEMRRVAAASATAVTNASAWAGDLSVAVAVSPEKTFSSAATGLGPPELVSRRRSVT
jgi:hypothetical protein